VDRDFLVDLFRRLCSEHSVSVDLLEHLILIEEEAEFHDAKRRRLTQYRKAIDEFLINALEPIPSSEKPEFFLVTNFPNVSFKKIILKNIGPFYGEHEVTFSELKDKPVTLVRGMNGTGKSTIFKSLGIALYGLENAVDRSRGLADQPTDFLHRHIREPKPEMSVELLLEIRGRFCQQACLKKRYAFNFSEQSKAHILREANSHTELKVDELYIRDEAEINMLIGRILPKAISRFFIFDGDYIASFIGASTETILAALRDSIGLNIISKVQKNIEILSKEARDRICDQEQNREKHISIRKELKKYEQEKAKLEKRLFNAKKDSQDLKEQLYRNQEKQKQLRIAFDPKVNARREELVREEQKISDELNQLKDGIRDCFSKPSTYKPLKRTLEQIREGASSFGQELLWILREIDDLEINLESIARRVNIDFNSVFQEPISIMNSLREKLREDLCPDGFAIELKTIEKTSLDRLLGELALPQNMGQLANKFEARLSNQRELNSELASLPVAEEFIGQKYEKLEERVKDLENAISQKIDDANNIKNRLSDIEQDIGKLNRELSESNTEISEEERAKSKVLDGLYELLADYGNQVFRKSLSQLETLASQSFNDLTNKPEHDWGIRIRHLENKVVLWTKGDGSEWALNERSEGEQQVVSISIINALSKLSSCKTPIVIDSPTMRLDETHRINLAKNFFPYVSTQAIVFAGEQELEGSFLKELRPYVGQDLELRKEAYGHGEQAFDRARIDRVQEG